MSDCAALADSPRHDCGSGACPGSYQQTLAEFRQPCGNRHCRPNTSCISIYGRGKGTFWERKNLQTLQPATSVADKGVISISNNFTREEGRPSFHGERCTCRSAIAFCSLRRSLLHGRAALPGEANANTTRSAKWLQETANHCKGGATPRTLQWTQGISRPCEAQRLSSDKPPAVRSEKAGSEVMSYFHLSLATLSICVPPWLQPTPWIPMTWRSFHCQSRPGVFW